MPLLHSRRCRSCRSACRKGRTLGRLIGRTVRLTGHPVKCRMWAISGRLAQARHARHRPVPDRRHRASSARPAGRPAAMPPWSSTTTRSKPRKVDRRWAMAIDGAALHQPVERLADQLLRPRRRGRKSPRRAARSANPSRGCAGDGDTLALAAGQARATVADHGRGNRFGSASMKSRRRAASAAARTSSSLASGRP